MKNNKLILLIILFISITSKCFSEEMKFDALKMDVKNNGEIIFAEDATLKIPNKNIKIVSKNIEYNKNMKFLKLTSNVFFYDKKNNLTIESDKISYDKKKEILFSEGKTKIVLENKYVLNSNDIYFNRASNKIFGNKDAIIEDYNKNIYKLKNTFEFDISQKIIKTKKSFIIDKYNNKYIFEDLMINLNSNEIAGKEIKVEFEKEYFGNNKNDPVLKGRSAYSNENELKVHKAVFSTCNIENKKCRGWELITNEFNHDKKNRIFEYKDTWIKLFDHKIFYFPYFNHPDPSVKRKSGFLTPSYSSSNNFGTSINIPYFKILDVDKDLTLSPRYYADKSFLFQNEYRQALENSDILSDFGFLIGDSGTKGHFFYNQIGNISDDLSYEINLQNVKGDNFLKNYSLTKTSNLISDDNLLLSNLDLNWKFTDSNLKTSFKVYEDLSRNYHDRYQYIFPDFDFTKKLKIPDNYNGTFDFRSYGYNKNYDTNILEAVFTNDFLFKSNSYVNKSGLSTNYTLLLKNSNNYSNNSQNFNDNADYDLFGTIKVDTGFPLQKITQDYNHYLQPILSLRYSPNGNSNLTNKDVIMDYNTVFDLNRIGSSYEVEGGESISLGLEFNKKDLNNMSIIDFKIANVLKPEENIYLPSKSRLNKKRSDIFGNIDYNLSNELKLGYKFSYDENLKYSNLEELDLNIVSNNLITNFIYYTEDFDIDNKETFRANSSLKLDKENKINFDLTRDLKNDYTQNYNVNYEYLTDCLSLSLGFNRSFYSDGNLEPSSNLTFLIKIIPFTEIGVSNLESVVGG